MTTVQSIAAGVFAAAAAIAILGWRRGVSGRALLLALLLSSIWAFSQDSLADDWLDLGRTAAWLLFLIRVAGIGQQSMATNSIAAPLLKVIVAVVAATGVLLAAGQTTSLDLVRTETLAWMLSALAGLVLVEQLLRNTQQRRLWSFKFIPLGVGVIFASDFLFHADAMLFGHTNPALAALRPLVHCLALPLLLVGSWRSQDQRLWDNMTRQPRLHTAVLTIAGGYLVLQSIAAFVLRAFGGEWNTVLIGTFSAAALVGLVVVLASSQLRARTAASLRGLLGLGRYDYRREWMRLNDALASRNPDDSWENSVLGAMAELTHTTSAALLRVTGSSASPVLHLAASWPYSMSGQINQPLATAVVGFFQDSNWVLETRLSRDGHLAPGQPDQLEALCQGIQPTLVLPLRIQDDIWGVLLLGERLTSHRLKTEDFDLFRIAARQVAGALAASALARDLEQAEQLHAASQMTSFLLHDLKTIVSQLSLLTANAERHKTNPAFIDDMVGTIDHSVGKMHKLVQKLSDQKAPQEQQTNAEAASPSSCQLLDLHQQLATTLADIVATAHLQPAPTLVCPQPLQAWADPEQLTTVLGHLLHNAADATPDDGSITVTVRPITGMPCIEVQDTGAGMSSAFVRDHLFRPFNSTKGVSGMGIGVFQSRQLIRGMGGDITVVSTPGEGTTFTISLLPPPVVALPRPATDVQQQHQSTDKESATHD